MRWALIERSVIGDRERAVLWVCCWPWGSLWGGGCCLVSRCRKNSRGSVSSRGPVQMQVGHLITASDCTEASWMWLKSAGILQQFQWGPGDRALRTQLSADPENRNKFICSVKRKCGDLIRWRKRSKSELASEEQQSKSLVSKTHGLFLCFTLMLAGWAGECLPASPVMGRGEMRTAQHSWVDVKKFTLVSNHGGCICSINNPLIISNSF